MKKKLKILKKRKVLKYTLCDKLENLMAFETRLKHVVASCYEEEEGSEEKADSFKYDMYIVYLIGFK